MLLALTMVMYGGRVWMVIHHLMQLIGKATIGHQIVAVMRPIQTHDSLCQSLSVLRSTQIGSLNKVCQLMPFYLVVDVPLPFHLFPKPDRGSMAYLWVPQSLQNKLLLQRVQSVNFVMIRLPCYLSVATIWEITSAIGSSFLNVVQHRPMVPTCQKSFLSIGFARMKMASLSGLDLERIFVCLSGFLNVLANLYKPLQSPTIHQSDFCQNQMRLICLASIML
mmetsp:Transcript_16620/g.24794  ORF Transcript_16620/g.24794 Transcript_16620/m.24794 type:complete len:222 (+) Transcript_16620:1102-1767(+)